MARAVINKLNRKREGGIGKAVIWRVRDWRRGFGSTVLCFISFNKESVRFHSVTCSCIVELRKAVTLSWIFFSKLGFLLIFWREEQRSSVEGAQ
jgi:hypothetical protein